MLGCSSLLGGSQLPARTGENPVYSFIQQIVTDTYLCVRPSVSAGIEELSKPQCLRQEDFVFSRKTGEEAKHTGGCGGAGEGSLMPGDSCGRGGFLKKSGLHGEFRVHSAVQMKVGKGRGGHPREAQSQGLDIVSGQDES